MDYFLIITHFTGKRKGVPAKEQPRASSWGHPGLSEPIMIFCMKVER